MNFPQASTELVLRLFKPLASAPARGPEPAPGAFAKAAEARVSAVEPGGYITIGRKDALHALLARAAVEIWHRGIHSFLVSAATTHTSPIWSSVCGYYASHYSVRGLAHLLGFFQLYRAKKILIFEPFGNGIKCGVERKSGADREHKFYWKAVHRSAAFSSSDLFHLNEECATDSDAAHRNMANYTELINRYPPFTVLEKQLLIDRVNKISSIQIGAAPIPSRTRFPDVEAVQICAYRRIVLFRQVLDGILSVSANRYWSVHRSPGWISGLMDFQVTETSALADVG